MFYWLEMVAVGIPLHLQLSRVLGILLGCIASCIIFARDTCLEFGMYSLPDEGHFSSSSSFLRDFVCVVVKESLLPDG